MDKKIKKVFTNGRVMVLLIVLLLSVVAISPNPWNSGVVIKNVISNSSANSAGITNPKPGTQAMSLERITSINNKPILDIQDYYTQISYLQLNRTVNIKTNKASYMLKTRENVIEIELNET
ncbi:MAG: hypothetical protein ABIJ08_02190, partial [Nanoarchaeota archaeon]